MTRHSQMVAVRKDVEKRYEFISFASYKKLEKPEPLAGIQKTYQPKDELNGEKLAPQGVLVQLNVEDTLADIADVGTRYLDVLGTIERTNQNARADVVVDDQVLIPDVPVTFLLALERHLGEELVQAKKLPTLSPEYKWVDSDEFGVSVIDPAIVTNRTKKVRQNHVKAEATDKHPAQVETYDEDRIVGDWTTRIFSGAVHPKRKRQIVERIIKLQQAVKQAREEANTVTAVDFKTGGLVYGYIFGA